MVLDLVVSYGISGSRFALSAAGVVFSHTEMYSSTKALLYLSFSFWFVLYCTASHF